ncbi:hypothetical protein JCM8547_000203 [Rhodosporidiobolus lusitaniae]
MGYQINKEGRINLLRSERFLENWYRRSTPYGVKDLIAGLPATQLAAPNFLPNPLNSPFASGDLNQLGCEIFQGLQSGIPAPLLAPSSSTRRWPPPLPARRCATTAERSTDERHFPKVAVCVVLVEEERLSILSNCTPFVEDGRWRSITWFNENVRATLNAANRERFQTALAQLVKEVQEDDEITVVGPIEKNGQPIYPEENSCQRTQTILDRHLASLRVVPRCTTDTYLFSWGKVEGDGAEYLVAYGPMFMLTSFAVPILFLATDGRMTLARLWELYMRQVADSGYPFREVDYGGLDQHRNNEQPYDVLPALQHLWERKGATRIISKVKA